MSATENLTPDDAEAAVVSERPKKKKHWQPKNQFFIVFSPSGEAPPIAVHQKHQDALGIAWRMARKHPGQEFFVMGSMSRPCLVEAADAAPEQVSA